jgi:hypothetical protein
MTTVERLKRQVAALTPEEIARSREWFFEYYGRRIRAERGHNTIG